MALWSRIKSYPRILKTMQLAACRSPWPSASPRAVQCLSGLAAVMATVLAYGGAARAQVDFDYDFENLELGTINQQDGWTDICGNDNAWVRTGQGVNSSKTVSGPSFGCSQDTRSLPEPFYYTAADSAVVWSFQGLVGVSCCNSNAIVAFLGPSTVNFGLDKTTEEVLRARLSAGPIYGDALAFTHWYEIQVTVDFSVVGGLATLAYRDLTLGQDTFTVDEILRNINLGATADAQGRYTFHTAYTRQDSANGVCWVDNIHFEAPAPPCSAHTGDMNGDTAVNGRDIQRFVDALLVGSTAFADTCPGDFSNSGAIDVADMGGFVSLILN